MMLYIFSFASSLDKDFPVVFQLGIGAVHILRQPPEGGEGVSQMLTIADEGGLSQR